MRTAAWTTNLPTLASRKEVRQLLVEVARNGGWSGRQTSGSHIMLRHVNGGLVTLASTPSDDRALANVRALIKRAEAR